MSGHFFFVNSITLLTQAGLSNVQNLSEAQNTLSKMLWMIGWVAPNLLAELLSGEFCTTVYIGIFFASRLD